MVLAELEKRFAEIIWENAPIHSGELVKICEKEFSWKKSTTYTVLRRLCDKGIFINRDGKVQVLISREDYHADESQAVVKDMFNGSLPMFITAFTKKQKLSKEEIEEIKRMLESC